MADPHQVAEAPLRSFQQPSHVQSVTPDRDGGWMARAGTEPRMGWGQHEGLSDGSYCCSRYSRTSQCERPFPVERLEKGLVPSQQQLQCCLPRPAGTSASCATPGSHAVDAGWAIPLANGQRGSTLDNTNPPPTPSCKQPFLPCESGHCSPQQPQQCLPNHTSSRRQPVRMVLVALLALMAACPMHLGMAFAAASPTSRLRRGAQAMDPSLVTRLDPQILLEGQGGGVSGSPTPQRPGAPGEGAGAPSPQGASGAFARLKALQAALQAPAPVRRRFRKNRPRPPAFFPAPPAPSPGLAYPTPSAPPSAPTPPAPFPPSPTPPSPAPPSLAPPLPAPPSPMPPASPVAPPPLLPGHPPPQQPPSVQPPPSPPPPSVPLPAPNAPDSPASSPSSSPAPESLPNPLPGSGGAPGTPTGDAFPPAPPQHPVWPPLSPLGGGPPQPPPADPLTYGRYDIIGSSMVVGVHLTAVPGTDKFLFMERPSGYHPDDSRTIAGFLDLPKLLAVGPDNSVEAWTHIQSPDGLFCCGHTFLDTGDVLVVGGHQANAGYPDGMKSVRTVNRSTTDLQLRKIREMGWRRWYPTATLLPDGKALVMGGTQGVGAGTANNPFWEMIDTKTWNIDQYPMRVQYLTESEQIYYPFNYVLPTGYMFTFCGRSGYVMDYNTNNWFTAVPRLRGYATTQYPFTGTSVILPLYPENNYSVEIMLFGGQKESTVRNLDTPANKNQNRIKLIWDPVAKNYTFDGWLQEKTIAPRVMPDSVLLPNGKVIVLNGAQRGLAGDSASGGESRANYPVLYAEEYDPTGPVNERTRKMAKTLIARMYHSTTSLTTNGTILVAGCDRCYRFQVSPGTPYIPSPTSKAEYRLEIYTPPYVLMESQKPEIVALSSDTMVYREPFSVTYRFPSGDSSLRITRVVLVAPSSCTHSYNTNQRVVGLEIVNDMPQEGVIVVRGPPSIYIAPPQMYMLFVLSGDVYSAAKWVTLPRPASGPALLPMDV